MAEKKDLNTLYEFDSAVRNELDGGLLCGTDEAGRGPLAGDATVSSLGRGAGNCPSELLLGFLKKVL